MRRYLLLYLFILVFLISMPFASTHAIAAERQTTTSSTSTTHKANPSYSGYTVDGRTSASILSAKRSHEVAKEDEIGLKVFSGLFVIALIAFFAHHFYEKR